MLFYLIQFLYLFSLKLNKKYYLISNNNQIKNIKLKLIIIYINYLLYFNSIIIIKFKYIQKYLIYIN